MSCPETLVFDPSTNRCEEPQNVAECRNSSTVTADVSSDSTTTPLCVGRKDSIYPLDPCSQSYLQCYNQVNFIENFSHFEYFGIEFTILLVRAVYIHSEYAEELSRLF